MYGELSCSLYGIQENPMRLDFFVKLKYEKVL